jgi:hypothetical protein
MDSDHRLLLRCTKPLLQSRNSAVGIIYSEKEFFIWSLDEILNRKLY